MPLNLTAVVKSVKTLYSPLTGVLEPTVPLRRTDRQSAGVSTRRTICRPECRPPYQACASALLCSCLTVVCALTGCGLIDTSTATHFSFVSGLAPPRNCQHIMTKGNLPDGMKLSHTNQVSWFARVFILRRAHQLLRALTTSEDAALTPDPSVLCTGGLASIGSQ